MKHLHQQATRLFARVLAKLGEENETTLPGEGTEKLFITRLAGTVETEAGRAARLQLTYQRKTVEETEKTEMRFLVLDDRSHPRDFARLVVMPYAYEEAGAEGTGESIDTDDDGRIIHYRAPYQAEQVSLAQNWLRFLHEQTIL